MSFSVQSSQLYVTHKHGDGNFMDSEISIDQEKYYVLTPSVNTIEVNHENQNLLFPTPNILQIKCRNIRSYPFDSEYTKTIGVINVSCCPNKIDINSHLIVTRWLDKEWQPQGIRTNDITNTHGSYKYYGLKFLQFYKIPTNN